MLINSKLVDNFVNNVASEHVETLINPRKFVAEQTKINLCLALF